MIQVFWSVAAILVGVLMFGGALLRPERLMQTGRVSLIVDAFGRSFTRGLYVLSGVSCVMLGVYLLG